MPPTSCCKTHRMSRRRSGPSGTILTLALSTVTLLQAADGDLDPRFGATGINSIGFQARALALQPDGKIVAVGGGVARFHVDGGPDETFGQGGTAPAIFDANGVAMQEDKKIVVVGRSGNDFGVARYNADGTLDRRFGNRGIVTTDFGDVESAQGVALQAHDNQWKIVVVGGTFTAVHVARYRHDGSLDPSFGVGGKVVTGLGGASAVALQADGKIVVAGTGVRPLSIRNDFLLIRYSEDGSLDPTFGAGGIVYTDFGGRIDRASALVIQPDGRIVAAGGVGANRVFTPSDFGLARYLDDGSLDGTFGVGGRVRTIFNETADVPDLSAAFGIALQPDGKIAVAGFVFSLLVSDSSQMALVQYDAFGIPDATFGDGGSVVTDLGSGADSARAVAVQPDGKIVLAADRGTSGSYVLARYLYESIRGPFDGAPREIPGRIEGEDYDLGGNAVGYFDATPGHEDVFAYRTDDVDIKASSEGGFTIGWFAAGEWLNYTAEVLESGDYSIRARVGSALPNRTFHIEIDGRDVTGPIPVPLVRDWDRYRTVRVPHVHLDAGQRSVRVVMGPEDFMDLQWLEFQPEPHSFNTSF